MQCIIFISLLKHCVSKFAHNEIPTIVQRHVNAQIYFFVHVIVNVTEDTLSLSKLTRTKLYKYAAHLCFESFVRSVSCGHGMTLYVFRFFVTCYLTCILCKNAVSGSTLAKVFSPTNNAFQSNERMSEIDNKRTEQSIETETRTDGITLKRKDDSPKFPRESLLMQDLLMKMRILNDFEKTNCSRFVINLRSNKDLCKNNNKYINIIFIIFIMFQSLADIFIT